MGPSKCKKEEEIARHETESTANFARPRDWNCWKQQWLFKHDELVKQPICCQEKVGRWG